MEIFKEAGLPDGVINMVTVDGPVAGDVVFNQNVTLGNAATDDITLEGTIKSG